MCGYEHEMKDDEYRREYGRKKKPTSDLIQIYLQRNKTLKAPNMT